MNKQILSTARLVVLMFLTLAVALSLTQVINAPSLRADERNKRTLYESYKVERGPIIVAGKKIAYSEPSEDEFKFLRLYSAGPLYAPVTGYHSVTFQSATGLESVTNEELSGTASSQWISRLEQLLAGAKPRGGAIELTINPAVQEAAWEALGERRGAVVAIEPGSGRILALVSRPSFDPNLLTSHDTSANRERYTELENDPARPLVNRAIAGDLYAPGSTFKVVTASALLTHKLITPETEIDAPAEVTLPGTDSVLINYGGAECGDGRVTFQEAFDQSCNTPFVELSQKLGTERLAAEAKAYGFGEPLEIPLQVTRSNFPEGSDPAQNAMLSIGQYDLRATPLQMALVAATIANNGVQMQPYLIERELSADLETTATTSPQTLRQSTSPEVAQTLNQMMVSEVENGTGEAAGLPGVDVAGKTGTAQTGSDEGGPHTWFVGFAPANKPTIAVAVFVEGGEQAADTDTGGAVAAPIARAVFEAALR